MIRLSTMCLTCAMIVALPLAGLADETTPSKILADPAAFDGKTVTVKGKISKLTAKTSKKGSAYVTLSLSDETVKEITDKTGTISVFMKGTTACKDGQVATAAGTFVKTKVVSKDYTVTNQVDATSLTCRAAAGE